MRIEAARAQQYTAQQAPVRDPRAVARSGRLHRGHEHGRSRWLRLRDRTPADELKQLIVGVDWRLVVGGGRSAHPGTLLAAALCASLTLGGSASAAADSAEFWPEAALFYQLSPQTRLYLDAAYASDPQSDVQSLDLVVALDISIKPIVRKQLRTLDWQRSRYFWMRTGYTRVGKAENGMRQNPEDRLFAQLSGKAELPAEIGLEGRARVDLRWIGGDYSERYRLRVEVNREFQVHERTILPYFNVEWFYDTRYDRWSRKLYQAGGEFTVSPHFRFEVYLARQHDHLPTESSVDALGLMAKWYY